MVRIEVVLASFMVAAVVTSLWVISANPNPVSTTSSTSTTSSSSSTSVTSTTCSSLLFSSQFPVTISVNNVVLANFSNNGANSCVPNAVTVNGSVGVPPVLISINGNPYATSLTCNSTSDSFVSCPTFSQPASSNGAWSTTISFHPKTGSGNRETYSFASISQASPSGPSYPLYFQIIVTLSSSTTTTTSASSTSTSTQGLGIANGTISIGPLRPVCLVNSTAGPAPSNIASIQVVATSDSGRTTYLPVDWSLYAQCEARGQFQAALQPGNYTLDLSSCTFLGCKNSLPKAFVIEPDRVTIIDISIDTGIR